MGGDPWIYLDGNAVSKLWDQHTALNPEGATGDARSTTPFQHVVLSDYSVDELVSVPVGNAYKKHLVFLTIFPDIPVLKSPEHLDLDQASKDRRLLLQPPDHLRGGITSRILALAGVPAAVADLTADIDRKNAARAMSAANAPVAHVPPESRVSLTDAIKLAVDSRGLDPKGSAADFFALCKMLFTFDAARLIERPSRHRKGATRLLNQQIDYYHLSYLPFIDGFVTDDVALRETAAVLSATFHPNVEIFRANEYQARWNRDTLLSS